MSVFRTIFRGVKFAFQNFWRNIWLSLATVLVFVLTLFTINILMTTGVLADGVIEGIENKIDVSVTFQQGTPEQMVLETREYLLNLSQVSSVDYVSEEEHLQRFTERHQNNVMIQNALDFAGSTPFGSSLVVRANDPSDFDFILEALNNPSFSDKIEKRDMSDRTAVIALLRQSVEKTRYAMIVLAGIFTLIALLVVFNSIRVSIYTHRKEIGIMQLVGASDGFIKLPFALEAVIMSVLAVGISFGLWFLLVSFLEPRLMIWLGQTDIGLVDYYRTHLWLIVGGQLGSLIVLALISSSIAMRRHLKV